MSGYVGVYLTKDGTFIVRSSSKIVSGPYVANGWVRKLTFADTDGDLGRAVLDGLDHSELDVPDVAREEIARREQLMFRLAGTRSRTRFSTGTRLIAVERDLADALTITPAKNAGPRRGFLFLSNDHSVVLYTPYDEDAVGSAIREGLDRAE